MTKQGRPEVPLAVRFFRFVNASSTLDCWNWQGAKDREGYGFIKRKDGKQLRAHRVSYEIHKAPLKDEEVVCHSCDNPSCVNPDHLFAGSLSDNTQDMLKKNRRKHHIGRANGVHATENPKRKLSEEDALAIKYSNGVSASELSKRFGVTPATIRDIKRGTTWKFL